MRIGFMKSLLWPPEKVLSGKMARASSGGSYFSGLSIFSKNSCSFQEGSPPPLPTFLCVVIFMHRGCNASLLLGFLLILCFWDRSAILRLHCHGVLDSAGHYIHWTGCTELEKRSHCNQTARGMTAPPPNFTFLTQFFRCLAESLWYITALFSSKLKENINP